MRALRPGAYVPVARSVIMESILKGVGWGGACTFAGKPRTTAVQSTERAENNGGD